MTLPPDIHTLATQRGSVFGRDGDFGPAPWCPVTASFRIAVPPKATRAMGS